MALFYPPCTVSTPIMASLVPIHGLVHPRERRRLDILQNSVCETKFFDKNWSPLGWISGRKESYHMRCSQVESAANEHAPFSFQNNEPDSEPFWSSLTKEAYWCLRSLVVFLVAQPSQLRYIEWPSFKSTLKTATLTLVLVALLIVALSSVDAALWYLLSLILRRSA